MKTALRSIPKWLGLLVMAGVLATPACQDKASQQKLELTLREMGELKGEFARLRAEGEDAAEDAAAERDELKAKIGTLNGKIKELESDQTEILKERDEAAQELEKTREEFNDYRKKYTARMRTEAIGKRFDEIETEAGKVYRNVVIRKVDDHAVYIRHQNGSTSVACLDAPREWLMKFGLIPEVVVEVVVPSGPEPDLAGETGKLEQVSRNGLPEAVRQSVLVIEGDRGTGVGFLCRVGDEHYIYTAAHVLSGNTTLRITVPGGRTLEKFAYLEVAEGVDLLRIKVDEPIRNSLLLANQDESGSLKLGSKIVAIGGDGVRRHLSRLSGTIQKMDPERFEIESEAMQGSGGGPILLDQAWTVVGLVTQAVPPRRDVFAPAPTTKEASRFVCRLDRDYEWTRLGAGEFLAEGHRIERLDRVTRLLFALAVLKPSQKGVRFDARVQGGETVRSIFQENKDMRVVTELIVMNAALGEKKLRTSERDVIKGFTKLYEGALRASGTQVQSLSSGGVSYYHREALSKSLEWRKEAETALRDLISEVGR